MEAFQAALRLQNGFAPGALFPFRGSHETENVSRRVSVPYVREHGICGMAHGSNRAPGTDGFAVGISGLPGHGAEDSSASEEPDAYLRSVSGDGSLQPVAATARILAVNTTADQEQHASEAVHCGSTTTTASTTCPRSSPLSRCSRRLCASNSATSDPGDYRHWIWSYRATS